MRANASRSTLAVMLVAAATAPLSGQGIEARASSLTLGGRLQVQYANSSVDGAVDDVFLRRARLELDGALTDRLDGRLQVDFGGGQAAVKDAWVRYDMLDGLRVTAGQFKRPFSIFELASSTDLPIIERDGRIEGLSVCPGVGGVCTFSRLTEKLSFDDRDLGVRLEGRAGERVTWLASVTNGTGGDAPDENDGKSLSGRLEVAVSEGVVLSPFGALHDHVGPDGATEWAPAVGADVEVGTWRDGIHLMAALAMGENWAASDEADFTTAQALVSRYLPTGGRLAGIEPLLRVSWSSVDGDSPAEGGQGLLVTPGLLLYVAGKNALALNLDLYDPDGGGWEWSFKVQSFLYF